MHRRDSKQLRKLWADMKCQQREMLLKGSLSAAVDLPPQLKSLKICLHGVNIMQDFSKCFFSRFTRESDLKRARLENGDTVKEPSLKRRRSEDRSSTSPCPVTNRKIWKRGMNSNHCRSADEELDGIVCLSPRRSPVSKQKVQPNVSDEVKVLNTAETRRHNSMTPTRVRRKSSVDSTRSPVLWRSRNSPSRSSHSKSMFMGEKKMQLTLYERKMSYMELIKSTMDEPSLTSPSHNFSIKNFKVSKPTNFDTPPNGIILNGQNMFQNVIDGTNTENVSEPPGKQDDSDELQYVGSVCRANTFELDLKEKSVYNNLIKDIKEKYRRKEEASKKREEEERIKADITKKRNEKLHMDAVERLARYLALTEEIVEEKSELLELTPDMENVIDNALMPKPKDEVLVSEFGLVIKRHDMQTLTNKKWLNDEVINFYMELLKERGKLDNYPSVHSFSTFFYPTLLRGGHPLLKRWTKKVDIFSFDLVVVPVHLEVHWCLSVIDFRSKTIKYYDSMGMANNDCLEKLLKYLQDESLDKRKIPFDTSGWCMENVRDIPQQLNNFDCGVFTCMFAEYVCRNANLTFTQDDMCYFRRKMVYEIFTHRLML